ncbi:helix-turn-helix transcriptional regulator [uncultured Acetatifactor sp.]|uniref:helix-turn-helix domain-containing protein n=1 Tax=uncultured Acetatifactor sp. TaxID=1671927 RepID=UPI00263913AC|nr:helix-turn-helix transcriptional regulator [uncultured Acetatifactor sp.]
MSEEEYKIIFSKNLRYYLELDGRTQADLCEFMKVSSATVSDWCNGKKMPRMDKIQTICNWLRIEKSDLLEDKGNKNSSYYLYDDAKEFAEFLYANPEYRVLFDASRKVKKDDIQFVKEMIDRVSDKR